VLDPPTLKLLLIFKMCHFFGTRFLSSTDEGTTLLLSFVQAPLARVQKTSQRGKVVNAVPANFDLNFP
jgi:hypothetical protein